MHLWDVIGVDEIVEMLNVVKTTNLKTVVMIKINPGKTKKLQSYSDVLGNFLHLPNLTSVYAAFKIYFLEINSFAIISNADEFQKKKLFLKKS